jgi:hypothetical protein
MTAIVQGAREQRTLAAGEILTITTDAVSTARYGRLNDQPGGAVPDLPSTYTALAASKGATVGPYPTLTR